MRRYICFIVVGLILATIPYSSLLAQSEVNVQISKSPLEFLQPGNLFALSVPGQLAANQANLVSSAEELEIEVHQQTTQANNNYLVHSSQGIVHSQAGEGFFNATLVNSEFYGLLQTASGQRFLIKSNNLNQIQLSSTTERNEGNDAIPTAALSTLSSNPTATQLTNSSTAVVDVLVAFTPLAAQQLGGVSSALALIGTSIDLTNQALIDSSESGAPAAWLHPVGTIQLAQPATLNLSTELLRLTLSDGYYDEVLAARQNLGADLVIEIAPGGSDSCGMSFVPDSNFDSNLAFAVVAQDCAVANLSFAHEVGHLFGMNHNIEAPNPASVLFPYAYGYRFQAQDGYFRTIMAYDYAPEGGLSAKRIARFSNPLINFAGTSVGLADSANNAAVIAATSQTIANYRPSIGTQAGILPLQIDHFLISMKSRAIRTTRTPKTIQIRTTLSGPGQRPLKLQARVGRRNCSKILSFNVPASGKLNLTANLSPIDRPTDIGFTISNSFGELTDSKKIRLTVAHPKKGANQSQAAYYKLLCQQLGKLK